MVKVKENTGWYGDDGQIDKEKWLETLGNKGYLEDLPLIRHACTITELASSGLATETGISCFEYALFMADLLADLEADAESITAAMVYVSVHYAEFSLDDISLQLGPLIERLVKGVENMGALQLFHKSLSRHTEERGQQEMIRKMLLAMVDDPRIVLIKLVERLLLLRHAQDLPASIQEKMASEVMGIYAPLANRLGIGALKWEMEDLAFRYIEPEAYKTIAKGLKTRRLERDRYVALIVDLLNEHISAEGISHFAVYGRAKHIHSIHRKMQRKNVSLEEIYDATAVRVLTETLPQCYDILSIVHSLWEQVPQEFDDYIVAPKENGYQSLHTAVRGPEGRVFEVQIRTYEMHQLAEMGVAAHWKYKEGSASQKESHERKIEWLRDVLSWHREMATSSGISKELGKEFLEERVYVFTPDGDVLDLPEGATPLDFAYQVHSELGHRCRGTKINGTMVPLTTELKTGDVVEVLSGREPRPSRDWLNPHLHYLKTSRARAKVLHWFRMQDYDKHRVDGQEMLTSELKTLGLKMDSIDGILKKLHYKSLDDMLAALGRGDLRMSQILGRLSAGETVSAPPLMKSHHKAEISRNDLSVSGVGQLLTTMARCCQPLPGDEIIGYITVGRGISVHRRDCSNILHATERQRMRFVEVSWGVSLEEHYRVDVLVKAFDRPSLLKDLTSLLATEKLSVASMKSETNRDDNRVLITLSLEINSLNALSKLLLKMAKIPNVLEARRLV